MKLIVYHSEDFDGYFSAIITTFGIIRKYRNSDTHPFIKDFIKDNIVYFPYNHQKESTLALSNIVEGAKIDEIFFVDCMIIDEFFIKELLKKEITIYTLDHHETSFKWQSETLRDSLSKEQLNYFIMQSINSSSGETDHLISSVELCYHYAFAYNKELPFYIPNIIKYVSAYDIWNKTRFPWYEETLAIQYGLRSIKDFDFNDILDFFNKQSLFRSFFDYIFSIKGNTCPYSINRIKELDKELCDSFKEKGKIILNYIEERNSKIIKFGKEVTLQIHDDKNVETFAKCFFAMDYCNNSLLFENGLDNIEDYNLLILAKPNVFTPGKMVVTIITNFSNSIKSISAGELCKKLGGGGHAGIGGCTVKYSITEKTDNKYVLDFYKDE